jgi:hypothetical protein
MHRIIEKNTKWDNAITTGAKYTDPELAKAEDWNPPVGDIWKEKP